MVRRAKVIGIGNVSKEPVVGKDTVPAKRQGATSAAAGSGKRQKITSAGSKVDPALKSRYVFSTGAVVCALSCCY